MKGKIIPLILLGIILIALPLLLIGVRQTLENRSHAAPGDQLEAEAGVRAGNATPQSDNNASGNQYIVLGINQISTPIPTSGQTAGLSQCTALDKGTGTIITTNLSMPGYLQSVTDPAYGTKITRVTGDVGTTIPYVSAGTWRTPGGPVYSKLPAWNADESLLLLQNTSAPGALFLNGSTYQPELYRSYGPMNYQEVRWHPTDPNLLIYVTDSGATGYWNVRTNAVDQKNAGIGSSTCRIGPYEGNVSSDGRKVVISCGTSFYVVDLSTGSRISPIISISQLGLSELDWASITPDGNRIVVTPNSRGPQIVLSFTPTSFTQVTSWGYMDHYDMGYDASGNVVAVSTDSSLGAFMVNLATGVQTTINSAIKSFDRHTTMRNIQVPGWAYTSLERKGGGISSALDDEILAFEVKPGGKVLRIGKHRSTITNADVYERTPFGAVSPDGKRVFYRSDWGNSTGPVYGFIVDTRTVCP
jgi:hypothetical protein